MMENKEKHINFLTSMILGSVILAVPGFLALKTNNFDFMWLYIFCMPIGLYFWMVKSVDSL